MTAYEKKYSVFSFIKDKCNESDSNDDSKSDVAQKGDNEDEVSSEDTSSYDEVSSEDTSSYDDEVSSEDTSSCDDETSNENEIEALFNNEDRLISILYREVVDVIMESNNLKESTVNNAISDMKMRLYQRVKKHFRNFPGIDFSRPKNCCGYLRRYAVCHTGLVKKLMWTFFLKYRPGNMSVEEDPGTTSVKEIIHKKHLKVVSLGGGPGNDIVGFCCALQEIPNSIENLDLIVVDINEGWRSVFPEILRKAVGADFGTFRQCLKKKINHAFMKVDLTEDKIFQDKDLSSVLGQSDILLMVKLISFLPDEKADPLLHNVVDAMKPGAMLIFIDSPFYAEFFRQIECLDRIYYDHLQYKMSFKRSNQSPSIKSAQAHLAILKKKIGDEDSSDGEEA